MPDPDPAPTWSLVESSAVREPPGSSTLGGDYTFRLNRLSWDIRVESARFGPLTRWRVWAVARELPEATVGLSDPEGPPVHASLGAARARARMLAEVLGGSIRDGQLVVERVSPCSESATSSGYRVRRGSGPSTTSGATFV